MEIKLATTELKKMKVSLLESAAPSLTKLFSKTKFRGWKVVAYKKKQVFFRHPDGYTFRVDEDKVGGDTMYSVYIEWPTDVEVVVSDPDLYVKDVLGKKYTISVMLNEEELVGKMSALNAIIKRFGETTKKK